MTDIIGDYEALMDPETWSLRPEWDIWNGSILLTADGFIAQTISSMLCCWELYDAETLEYVDHDGGMVEESRFPLTIVKRTEKKMGLSMRRGDKDWVNFRVRSVLEFRNNNSGGAAALAEGAL